MTKLKLSVSVSDVEEAIGIPANQWRGRCFEIASQVIKHGVVEGTVCYGVWRGAIELGSMFHGKPYIHHGWIEMEDGTIVDPTRWVFECKDPYIFIGENSGEYDFGGNDSHSELFGTEIPENDKSRPQLDMPAEGKIRDILLFLLGDVPTIGDNQAFKIANLHPKLLLVPEIVYAWLDENRMGGFVPIDNWCRYMD